MYEETILNTFEQKQNGVTRNPNPIGILGVDVNLWIFSDEQKFSSILRHILFEGNAKNVLSSLVLLKKTFVYVPLLK